MNLLAIDASTEYLSVALISGLKTHTLEEHGVKKHAELILAMIDSLLFEANMKLSDLTAVAFGRGPGNFTGLRIACSIAKGIAYAKDLLLIPVSSLATIGYAAHLEKDKDCPCDILAMIDARMQQVYWAHFFKKFSYVEEKLSNPEEIVLKVNAQNEDYTGKNSLINDSPIILAGIGYELYQNKLPIEIRQSIVKNSIIYPKATTMIKLIKKFNINPVNRSDAVPIYLRNKVT